MGDFFFFSVAVSSLMSPVSDSEVFAVSEMHFGA